jgi:hypothetical protein
MIVLVTLNGRAQENRQVPFEFDPGLTVSVDLNRVMRLEFATGREKNEDLASSRFRAAGGVSFRIKPFRKNLLDLIDSDKQHRYVLGVGYEFSRTSDVVSRIEHRMIFEGSFRNTFPAKFLLTNRNRFELRWVDGFHFRYRNRLMFERPVKLKRLKLTPFGSAEAIWDQRYTRWNTFKYIGGVQVRLIRHTAVDLQYERQHCVVCSDPNTDIFGVNFNIFFRRKK